MEPRHHPTIRVCRIPEGSRPKGNPNALYRHPALPTNRASERFRFCEPSSHVLPPRTKVSRDLETFPASNATSSVPTAPSAPLDKGSR